MRVVDMIEGKDCCRDWKLFASCIPMLPAPSRPALTEIDVFLSIGRYDFHHMRELNALREMLDAFATIADHYREATAIGEQER